MLFYFEKVNLVAQTEMICSIYGEGIENAQTCQNWIATFHVKDLWVHDARPAWTSTNY